MTGLIVRRGEDDFEDLPLGNRDAILANYFDIGIHEYEGRQAHRVVLLFELADRRSDGKRFLLSKEFTACLNRQAFLYLFLVDWRGVDFTPAELKGFEMNRLLGKPATLRLGHQVNEKTSRAYTEIDAIFRALRSAEPMKVETPPEYIPPWVQRRIDAQIIPGYPRTLPDMPDQEEALSDAIPF